MAHARLWVEPLVRIGTPNGTQSGRCPIAAGRARGVGWLLETLHPPTLPNRSSTMSRKWLGRIFATLIVFSLAPMQPAPALAALPQPPQQSEATQAAQADASAVELLRDTLYIGRRRWTAPITSSLAVASSIWASCPSGGPRAAGEGSDAAAQPDAPAEEGYLRRISIYGGAYPTLQNSSFCAYDSWAADDAGLFFWGGGWLWRVTTAAPTVQTRITSYAIGRGTRCAGWHISLLDYRHTTLARAKVGYRQFRRRSQRVCCRNINCCAQPAHLRQQGLLAGQRGSAFSRGATAPRSALSLLLRAATAIT